MAFNLTVAMALSIVILPAHAKSAESEAEILKEAQTAATKKDLGEAAAKTGARGDGKGATWCTARTTIKAPPEIVWRAVHDERQNDPDIS